MYWLASKYPTSVAKFIIKNCSKLCMNSTKKLPTWGRGVSKNPKSCQHCLWMVPNGTWILPECNKEGLFWP